MKETIGIIYGSKEIDKYVNNMADLVKKSEKDHQRGVAIYGAGFVGSWAVKYLSSLGAKVNYFIDKDPQKKGTIIHGIPVVLPTDPIVSSCRTIYIAARHAVKDVINAMTGSDYNLISFDAYYVIKNFKRYTIVRDTYLNDMKSVETYNALLFAMLSGSVDSCRAVMQKDMYFALPEFSGTFDDIFVDAGAFVGDTVERFIWENMGTFKHIYAFEPGYRQFVALQKRVNRLSEEWAFDMSTVSLVRAGLSYEAGRMSYTFLQDSLLRHGLEVDSGGKNIDSLNSVEVFTLDSYLRGKPVTFIKADVEGMEMNLLRGSQSTIRRYKPKIAVCVYHYPSDLFEIAEYVRTLVPEYNFSLRQHAPLFGDFVLYCY